MIRVGPRNLSEQIAALRGGSDGQIITQRICGKYGEQSYRGNVFQGCRGVRSNVVAEGGTSTNFALWNPPYSNVNVVPIWWEMGVLAPDTLAITTYGLYVAAPFGLDESDFSGSVKTTSLISVYIRGVTPGVPGGAYVLPNVPKAIAWSPLQWPLAIHSYNTPILYRVFSFKPGGNATATATQLLPFRVDFEGTCIMPPDSVMTVQRIGGGNASSYVFNALWEEIPIQNL